MREIILNTKNKKVELLKQCDNSEIMVTKCRKWRNYLVSENNI